MSTVNIKVFDRTYNIEADNEKSEKILHEIESIIKQEWRIIKDDYSNLDEKDQKNYLLILLLSRLMEEMEKMKAEMKECLTTMQEMLFKLEKKLSEESSLK